MSIKALYRRAREARGWLAGNCLPLWATEGKHRDGGFMAALALNHRPPETPQLADNEAQTAMIALFALAGRVGFDSELASQLIADAEAAIMRGGAEPPPAPVGDGQLHRLNEVCEDLRVRLRALPGTPGEDAILGASAICRSFDRLMDDFLTPEGGWIAAYDASGLPAVRDMPAAQAGAIAKAFSPLLALIET